MADTRPKIDGYELIRELGRGSGGTVHLATDLKTKQQVAIKVLAKNADNRRAQRFQQEAQLAELLRHPDVATVHEHHVGPDGAWIVMEYVEGYPLAGLVREPTLSLQDRVHILARVALVLGYAHEHDVIHRDIKPSNIFVTREGDIRLLDFGIARYQNRAMTVAGTVVGSPGYLSPEQSQGQPIDARTDLFSLGLVGFELITGKHPWIADDTTKLLVARATEPPRDFAELFPRDWYEASDEEIASLGAILHRAIQQDPEARYGTARELAEALHGFMIARDPDAAAEGVERWGRRRIAWAVARSGAAPEREDAGPASTPSRAPAPADGAKANNTVWILAAALIVAIGLGIALLWPSG